MEEAVCVRFLDYGSDTFCHTQVCFIIYSGPGK